RLREDLGADDLADAQLDLEEVVEGDGVHGQLHHCRSHGSPSPLPSIFVFGQCWRKNRASAQEVICEHMVRPSQLNRGDGAGEAATAGTATGSGSSGVYPVKA